MRVSTSLNGTGQMQAEAVYYILEDWNLIDRVQFMSFDTTASNSGIIAGFCTILEQKLKTDLILSGIL